VLSLSAYIDPLTGEKMKITPADRAALNEPGLKAAESHYAYKSSTPAARATLFAGDAWAWKHGIQLLKPAVAPPSLATTAPAKDAGDVPNRP